MLDEDRTFLAGQRAEVRENRSVTIEYRLAGDSTLEEDEYDVSWKLPDGTLLNPGQNSDNAYVSAATRYLTLNSSQTSDSGMYTLILSNNAGSSSVTTNLQVFGMCLCIF